jgi:hypothetical protein
MDSGMCVNILFAVRSDYSSLTFIRNKGRKNTELQTCIHFDIYEVLPVPVIIFVVP